ARNVTVDEIVTAYKQACQKLNCKQIPKLLMQIQEFEDLAPRIDRLDLKGEKLDYKACEALEEIFKRVQFKIIDLEQTSLDEDGASALFDMIEYYESATHLNISFNKHIGTRGWQAAACMIRKTNCLQYLDARNTPLLDDSAPFVARALRISSSLVVLHLENASLSGRPLVLLASALKMNMNLRELYLADNKLNGLQDSSQLGNLLKFNCCIQILDLRNNHILDSGLAYICEGLKEQRRGLVTLVLWNNQLTHAGMAYLGMTLPQTQSLETLNLGHNPIGNEGVRNLKSGLIGNCSVLRLGLASTKLTCEGAVAVAEFFAESPRLLRLDLRENEIKTGGLMALSLALKVNHSLLRLDLDREPKKESVKSFIETQKTLLAEIQNSCKRNFILAKEKEEKEQKLQQSASMPEITVTEPLEEGPAEDGRDGNAASAPEEGEEAGETPTASENGNVEPAEDDRGDPPPLHITDELQRNASTGSPAASPASAPSQGNERRISVSSPGRGRKIFVVTRVEILPEQAADATCPWEDADATVKPAEPQSPALATKPELPAPQANGAVPESAAGSLTVPAAPSASSDPKRGDPAACESTAHDTPLPNGLKMDFAQALPEASLDSDRKIGSCTAEHELSCSKNEQELEELLLEASQDAGQEPL
ncbi:PPR37 phosphatase, partial [Oceanites oceanicus]|nr:PPR37 phosphatase [Oceanites oceanicus]